MASTISAGTTAGTAVAITGDTSGDLALLTQNGANTITVPNGTGTMAVNGVSSNIVAGTAVASTSGTSIDFTSIPSWVKRITINFNAVSTNGGSPVQVQLGDSGGVETTGYAGNSSTIGVAAYNLSTGFIVFAGVSSGQSWYGSIVLTSLASGNTWIANSNCTIPGGIGGSNVNTFVAGSKSLSDTLTSVRITINGSEVFDAGTINILYE